MIPDDGNSWRFSIHLISVDAYIQRLHASIDHSMAVAYRRNPHDPRNNVYVARITLCKGVPIYGYHVGWRFYLKIYMLNPAYMQRLADLLRNGSIMRCPLQPYEVHIPYLLQFMADYGLYGCGWVECEAVTFRAPVPAEEDSLDGQPSAWDDISIPRHLITSSKDKPRLSHCAIEIDLLSHHIRNRQTIKPRMLHYDFVERSHPVPLEKKLVHSMAELWRDEETRRAQRGENQPGPSMYTSVPRYDLNDGGKGPWIHENEMRAKLDDVIRAERARSDGHTLQFETFVKQTKFQSLVQTALESVTDMFPSDSPSSSQKKENYVGLNPSSGHLREDCGDFPSAHVDEARILALLNDSTENSWKDTTNVEDYDYVSESSYQSPSEVDFDDDLLGRGQDELLDVLFQRAHIDQRFKDPVRNQETSQFSDDLDLDFDVDSLTGNKLRITSPRLPTSVRASGNYSSTARYIEPSMPPDDGEPLRSRGGAATPELKMRKRETTPSSGSPTRKRMRFLDQNSDLLAQCALDTPTINLSVNSKSAASFSGMPAVQSRRPLPSEHRFEVSRFGNGSRPGPFAPSGIKPALLAKSLYQPREFFWGKFPPSITAILSTLTPLRVPRVLPRSAYYSKDEDVPMTSREYGGREFRLVSENLPFLGTFDCGFTFTGSIFEAAPRVNLYTGPCLRVWQFERKPPLNALLDITTGEPSVPPVVYGAQPGFIPFRVASILVIQTSRGPAISQVVSWITSLTLRLRGSHRKINLDLSSPKTEK